MYLNGGETCEEENNIFGTLLLVCHGGADRDGDSSAWAASESVLVVFVLFGASGIY